MAGGAAERARWAALRPALVRLGGAAEGGGPPPSGLEALRRSLGGVSDAHRRLLLAAAAADALLCTANARLLRRVPDHVHLQTHVHEPRWLVGDALPLESGETERLALAAMPALLGEWPSGG
mmetsp:Transcript_6503/g.20226  ORF Transcript_6503/g.20226 Transcript_6503/m.20226 type:complete len:122 (-) Transcript_6503:60-425(-)